VNAEMLHAIAIEVVQELEDGKLASQMRQLTDALNSMVNSPADANAQQTLASVRSGILSTLSSEVSLSNHFSPAWRQALEELGLAPLLGVELAHTIEDVLGRNSITPAVARDELVPLADRLTEIDAALREMLVAFRTLDIPSEELAPGEVEIGFTIPRGFVRNELGELGEEFEQLDRLLGPLLELATGNRPDLTVRSISSSDFSVLIDVAPEVGAVVSAAVAFLITQYKQLLEIRKLKMEMERLEMPVEAAAIVEQSANVRMNTAIGELVESLLDEYGDNVSDGHRVQELRMDLTRSLDGLAKRIDLGFHVEVRAEPPEVPDDVEEPHADQPIFDAIAARAPELQFVNYEGEPILGLPEHIPDPDDP
jgi:hypothetical protein